MNLGEKIMKYLVFFGCLMICCSAFAQNYGNVPGFMPSDIGYNLDRIVSSSMSSSSEQAAMINAQGDYLYKASLANINNQKAYALQLNNDVMKASAFFEKRQINGYNRALESLQRQEISRMKRDGTLSKESLDALFDVRYKTGYIIP